MVAVVVSAQAGQPAAGWPGSGFEEPPSPDAGHWFCRRLAEERAVRRRRVCREYRIRVADAGPRCRPRADGRRWRFPGGSVVDRVTPLCPGYPGPRHGRPVSVTACEFVRGDSLPGAVDAGQDGVRVRRPAPASALRARVNGWDIFGQAPAGPRLAAWRVSIWARVRNSGQFGIFSAA